MTPVIRVLVVVGTRLYREGLQQLLDAQNDCAVVIAEATGREAARRLLDAAPDVAIVDINTADLQELSVALEERAHVPLLAIGVDESSADVLACAQAGLSGYTTRDVSLDELLDTIRRVTDGQLIFPPGAVIGLVRRIRELTRGRGPSGPLSQLTRREREVAQLMCEGLSNKDIAQRLTIEVATVKNHVHSVLDKLHVHRRGDAARLLEPLPMRRTPHEA